MPKILQICVEGNTGSTGRLAESLGKTVISHGWESYIAHGRFPRSSESKIIKIGTFLDVFFHGIQTRLFDRHCLGSTRATRILVRKIKAIKPDIIHLHHLHGYYININILFDYLESASIPVIWTFHDCWSFTGHCAHFDFIGCDKWMSECNMCPQKNEYPASLLLDRSKNNFYLKKALFSSVKNITIVPVSVWLSNVVGKSFLGKIPRQVIYNGVNLNIFHDQTNNEEIRRKYGIGDRFMILGVANPWSERKGLYDFHKLYKYLEKDMVIVLVGLNRKQKKRLPENIIGLSPTENQQQLKDLYATADLFINLSVEETFGLTTAESLACGTPAVVYNSTACPEVIDSSTGFVVTKGDLEGITRAIDFVKKSGKDSFSRACKDRVSKLFNKEDRLAEYFNLYNSVCN